MINPFKIFTTPEFLFQPKITLKRFKRLVYKPNKIEHVILPWGAGISINPYEVIGSNIWCYGLFDLIVAEILWRLLDSGEVALDVGANIGQMTSLMGTRVGAAGKVYAFEAHPQIYEALNVNLDVWRRSPNFAQTKLFHAAVTADDKPVLIETGTNWNVNQGTAKVSTSTISNSSKTFEVPGLNLDQVLMSERTIGVCKMDVEGHEESVLLGATELLRSRRIRDIVFEEHEDFPAPVHKLLANYGYQIFSLHPTILKPQIRLASQGIRFRLGRGRDYLATLDAGRALKKLKPFGWRVLLTT